MTTRVAVISEAWLGGNLLPAYSCGSSPTSSHYWQFSRDIHSLSHMPVIWPLHAGKDWGQEEKGATEHEMVGWHLWLSGHKFEPTLGDGEGQGNLAYCNPWGCKELDTNEQLNNRNRTTPERQYTSSIVRALTERERERAKDNQWLKSDIVFISNFRSYSSETDFSHILVIRREPVSSFHTQGESERRNTKRQRSLRAILWAATFHPGEWVVRAHVTSA